MNSFWFDSQSAEEATGRCYVQVFAIRDGGDRPGPTVISEAGAGVLEDLDGRIDVRDDRRAVTAHHLPERACDVRTDSAGGQDLLGQHDCIHDVGGTQAAVGGDFVAPVTDLDPLRLRPENPRRAGVCTTPGTPQKP